MVLVEGIEHTINEFEECIQSPQKPSYTSTLLLPITDYSSTSLNLENKKEGNNIDPRKNKKVLITYKFTDSQKPDVIAFLETAKGKHVIVFRFRRPHLISGTLENYDPDTLAIQVKLDYDGSIKEIPFKKYYRIEKQWDGNSNTINPFYCHFLSKALGKNIEISIPNYYVYYGKMVDYNPEDDTIYVLCERKCYIICHAMHHDMVSYGDSGPERWVGVRK